MEIGSAGILGAASRIEVIQGRGRYGASWVAGRSRSTRKRCVRSIPCTSTHTHTLGPGQQLLRDPALRMLLVNARSVCNKALIIQDLIIDQAADLAFITETWLSEEGGVPLTELCPAGFKVWHQPRSRGRGGGVAVVIKESVEATRGTAPQIAGCETLWLKLGRKDQLGVLLVYRPPSCPTTSLPALLEALATLVVEHPRLMVLGDFNLPVDDPSSSAAREFIATLTTMDLIQQVKDQTHAAGHTLDLVFVSEQLRRDRLVGDLLVSPLSWSDHSMVSFCLSNATPYRREEGPIIMTRPRRRMEPEGFLKALGKFPEELAGGPPEAVVATWNRRVTKALDEIAPVRPLTVRSRPPAPWFTEELREMKRQKRRLERRWRKSKSESDRALIRAYLMTYRVAIQAAKKAFFSASIASAANRPLEMFQVVRSLIGSGDRQEYLKGRCEEYSRYLTDKVARIRSELDSDCTRSVQMSGAESSHVIWDRFDRVSPSEVDKVLCSLSKATCSLDPCPSWLVLASREGVRRWIQEVINTSLESGVCPAALKEAVVRPLLKKPSLDTSELNNFRPVSNIPFLGRVVEKVVVRQLRGILEETDYLDPFQSGFRSGHSTETTLVALSDDLWRSRDGGASTILVLLDLSAAFDTIDHSILLDRLRGLGVGGTVLQWFSSYLHGRVQTVKVGDECSNPRPLHYGVPQGSCLSPLLFNIYMKPLGEIIRRFGVKYHQYADDTQLYLSAPGRPSEAVDVLNQCLQAVKDWMGENKLKLNPDKTEWLWVFGPPSSEVILGLTLDGVALPQTECARNLGVLLDNQLRLESQVEAVARRTFARVRLVRQLRPYLEKEDLLTVAHALITSRLDYCNALYHGLPLRTTRKLQLVQNAAARTILGLPRYTHVTPLLRDLHWLPISFRAQFKVLVMTYKALYGTGPGYLRERLTAQNSSARPVRTNRLGMLRVPSTKECHLSATRERAFSVAAPSLWNTLPAELRQEQPTLLSFRKAIKTWLWEQAFNP